MRFAVKLGGSVITVKDKDFTARDDVIARLASELASAKERCLIVHGGGSFGHPVARQYDIHQGVLDAPEQRKGVAHTHRAMQRLNALVMDALLDAGMAACSVPPLAVCTLDDGRIATLDAGSVRFLAEHEITPVLYGDVARDFTKGFAIVSGDQLLQYLAPVLGIERVVLCTDVDGVFTADPKREPDARRIDVLTPETMADVQAGGSVKADVTGGMKGKLDELLTLARAGTESLIIDATRPGALAGALAGAIDQGTFIPVIT